MKISTYLSRMGIGLLAAFMILGFIELELNKNDRPLAIVKRLKPSLYVDKAEYDTPKYLSPDDGVGEQLFDGDTLTTEDGYALVVFMDKSIAKVKPNSRLVVRGETERTTKDSKTRIDLSLGEIFLEVEPQGNNDFDVATSRSLASVKGTKFGGRDDGFYWVTEGQVDVTATESGETVSLFEKMYAQVNETGDGVESGQLSDEELEDLDEGFDEIDEELIKKEIKFRFRDANGQIREVNVEYYEKGDGQ